MQKFQPAEYDIHLFVTRNRRTPSSRIVRVLAGVFTKESKRAMWAKRLDRGLEGKTPEFVPGGTRTTVHKALSLERDVEILHQELLLHGEHYESMLGQAFLLNLEDYQDDISRVCVSRRLGKGLARELFARREINRGDLIMVPGNTSYPSSKSQCGCIGFYDFNDDEILLRPILAYNTSKGTTTTPRSQTDCVHWETVVNVHPLMKYEQVVEIARRSAELSQR